MPGRNDPCPCGSGLKYKKCCLPKEDAARDAVRPRLTPRDTVMAKLLRFAFGPEFEHDRAIADVIFWADGLDGLSWDEARDLVESDDAATKYHTWLLFDLEIDDGKTIADMFLERRGRSLDPAERAYVERLRRSYLDLYEVEEVERGRGLHLRGILTKQRLFVHERIGSEQVVAWDLLGARVVPDEDGLLMFEGGLYLYAARDKAYLVRELKRVQRKFRREFPDADLAAFLSRSGMVFNYLWLDLVVRRPLPRMVTAKGDEMVFTKALFDLHDEPTLRRVFAEREDIDEQEDGSFVRLEDAGAFRRTLGTFRIENRRLVQETMSRERDEAGRAWLAEVAPGAATYRAAEIQTVAQAIAALREQPRRPDPEPAILPEVEAEVVREMQDRHYRDWLNEPVPALRDHTPREAAASKTLRPRLRNLLCEFDNAFERARLEGRQGYDTCWLWDELGLTRPRRDRRARAATDDPR